MTKWKIYFIILNGLLFNIIALNAENAIQEKIIKIGPDLPYIETQHFQQGSNIDPDGRNLDLNNYFIRYDGKPILPVMGEIHYSRYPKEEWEEALLKMKASGIQIIALYCFWLHHEEEEGHIRFDDNRDVRSFIELCSKHGLWVFPRLGPWCHGECRHGGFPDWFAEQRKSPWDRGYEGKLDPAVKRWYRALAQQFDGLYYKQGGPIIGIQVDNEVHTEGPGQWGFEYLSDLRNYAVEIGIDVPLYTVTGWPGPQVPEDLVIGLHGGYPAAPWAQHVKKLKPQDAFLFSSNRKDKAIGSDWGFGDFEETQIPIYRHPLLTVEMGGGNQISYHRRPTLIGKDMLALVYTRLGVGANMIGYYVYHGTQHPLSWNNEYSTQESRTTFHPYPNDYPMISYDFMAPLTEWGFIRDYYHDFKLIHQFLHHFGPDMAPLYAYLPEDNPDDPSDTDKLRYTVRSRGGHGYIIFNNYVRHLKMKDHDQVRFQIQMNDEVLTVPDQSINILNGVYGLFPFNYNMDGILLKYATAHPFNILDHEEKVYCFYAMKGILPEFKFDKSTINTIEVEMAKKTNRLTSFMSKN
ncbi:beta-galactosidase [bacterium]